MNQPGLMPAAMGPLPAIYLGSIKVDGLEGGSAIRVGPSISTGPPAAGGEGGGTSITLTDVRGDYSTGLVGCAFVFAPGAAPEAAPGAAGGAAGAGQAGAAGAAGGAAGAGGAAVRFPLRNPAESPVYTFVFPGGRTASQR